jgi:hypothetical protein
VMQYSIFSTDAKLLPELPDVVNGTDAQMI